MKLHILLTLLLAIDIHAFIPSTIQWMKLSGREMILAPKGFPSKVFAPPHELIVVDRLDRKMPSSMLPHFMVNLDGTISWDSWCIDGGENGDVHIKYCNGGPAQRWNVVPNGRGRKKIQLHGSEQCLVVADDPASSGSSRAASIKLRSCENERAGSWAFEEPGSPPVRSVSQLLATSSMMRHMMMGLISAAFLGALVSASWLWQHKKARVVPSSQGTMTLDFNQSGVSLVTPLAIHQEQRSTQEQRDMVPAVMSVSPAPEEDAEKDDAGQETNGAEDAEKSEAGQGTKGDEDAEKGDAGQGTNGDVVLDVILDEEPPPALHSDGVSGSTNKQKLDRFCPTPDPVLADPISKSPLQRKLVMVGSDTQEILFSDAGIQYPSKSAGARAKYFDLLPQKPITLTEIGTTLNELSTQIRDEVFNTFSVQTGLFRSPFTAFLYERGWRQNFKNAGFPGIEKEFAEVQEYFSPAQGGNVVDLSCGSGLMSRRLAGSGKYARVLALDFSEEMLKETNRRFVESSSSEDGLTLVRADAAALPLRLSSIDAIHAGAAMHCWPRLEQSLLEIRLSLKPGGRFFATTFFQDAWGPRLPLSRTPGGIGGFRFFKDEKELTDLLSMAGFSKVEVRREGRGCAIIRAEV